MNTIITDIYTLLSTAADFADDTGTHTKVEIFRDYDEKLIEIFPVIFMRRESVQMRIKSMPSKYECTYGVQIFVAVDNFVDRSEMEKSLDEIVTNVVKVLSSNPTYNSGLSGSTQWANSNVERVSYGTLNISGNGFKSAMILFTVKTLKQL